MKEGGGVCQIYNHIRICQEASRGHLLSTQPRKGGGVEQKRNQCVEGERVNFFQYPRTNVPLCMHFVIFSYARYFYHTLLSLATVFTVVL